jgi:hypothetical protein
VRAVAHAARQRDPAQLRLGLEVAPVVRAARRAAAAAAVVVPDEGARDGGGAV